MRFEKVSYTTFYKDMKKYLFDTISDKEINEAYDNIIKPERGTRYSACYDLHSPIKVTLKPRQMIVIPSGLKAYFSPQEMSGWCLELFDRSSMGIKYRVSLPNDVAIIDADYYNNEGNEGDIMIAICNDGYANFNIEAGDRVCQAKFSIYGVTSDDNPGGDRQGGIGSTGK